MMANIKVDPYEQARTLTEFVRMVVEAKGPEEMLACFHEAKRELKKEDYRLFLKMTNNQLEILLECGALFDPSL